MTRLSLNQVTVKLVGEVGYIRSILKRSLTFCPRSAVYRSVAATILTKVFSEIDLCIRYLHDNISLAAKRNETDR